MIVYCEICGKPIERRLRKNGRPESITQYSARRSCGRGTSCLGQLGAKISSGKPRRANGSFLPDAGEFSLRPKIVNGWQIL
jgi:hypothetical protein